MRKAENQVGRWQGFVVKQKIEGKPDKVVSGKFETTSGVQTYMELQMIAGKT